MAIIRKTFINLLVFLSRDVQIQFDAMKVLVKYASSEQTKGLCEELPDLSTFLLRELAQALAQPDHLNKRFSQDYHAAQFLELLAALCTSRDILIHQLVTLGLVTQLVASVTQVAASVTQVAASLQVDRTKLCAPACMEELRFAAKCLLSVLLVADGKYKDLVRKEFADTEGTLFHH